MSVRTATLAVARLTVGGNLDLAVVPAGETWIVKSMHGVNAAAGASDVIFYVSRPSLPANVYLFSKSTAVGEVFRLDCWVVLQPGDKLIGYASAPIVAFWVSGSKLIGLA